MISIFAAAGNANFDLLNGSSGRAKLAAWAATMTTSGVATFILAGSEESEAA
jgi:hypothetical protein